MRKPLSRVLQGSLKDMSQMYNCRVAQKELQMDQKAHYPSSKSIRIYESKCYKRDQATVSVDFGCGELTFTQPRR